MAFMQSRVGPYPFDVYGTLVADAPFGVRETQTLSFFPAFAFRVLPQTLWEPVLVHVLAHMWFGDSVSLELWRDIWLSEGHATWYETEFEAEHGLTDLDATMRDLYEHGDQVRAEFGPVARPLSARPDQLFGPNVFEGGALVLYALRQEVGDATFRRIERSWVRRYANDIAGTQDFIRHASQVAGRDLRGFLRAWLYGTKTPPMPGHPDWTVVRGEPGAEALPEPQADPRLARH
jgi:aminopeptidase N